MHEGPLNLRCRCGLLQGHVDARQAFARAICYCSDCQAFARFLGRHSDTLDAQGGTQIIAALPRAVAFTTGSDRLSCMSLSDKGMFRWYTSCCHTAIGNTPRDRALPYVGLIHTCLPGEAASLDESLGPVKVALNTGSALAPVRAAPIATWLGIARIMSRVVKARLTGKHKDNPFFVPASNAPVREPRVLSPTERQRLDASPRDQKF